MTRARLSPPAKPPSLTARLRRQLTRQYQDGARLPTIRTLARHYRVSEPTMRTALVTLASEGLVELQQGRGTYMKHRVANQHIAIVMDLDLGLPTFSYAWRRIAQQLRLFLQGHGYAARLYFGYDRPGSRSREVTCTDFVEAVARDQVCGVAMLYGPQSPAWVAPLEARRVPIIGTYPGFRHCVMNDRLGMVRSATRRLLAAGRRKIAFMHWAAADDNPPPRDAAVETFRAVLAQKGIAVNPRWISGSIHPNLPGSGWEEFRDIWLAGPEHPDALLITDDVLFQSAVPAIRELGIRVPEDLLIVAHANKGSNAYYPFPVWLMEVDLDEVATTLGTMLLQLLQGQPVHSPIVLPIRWVDSEETAASAPLSVRR